jgi:hypothetical protein
MRIILASVFVGLFVTACGPSGRDEIGGGSDDDGPPPGCVGLECQVVNCAKQNKPATSISGTVFAPNGTLALYGAQVYVPNVDPGPFTDEVACSRCDDQLPGDPVVQGISDTAGKFTISDVPSGTDVPLFITIGRWRRKVTIPEVLPCQDNPLSNTITSLPKSKAEGDIPRIAMATGGCDKLECLVRKLGVSDAEFTSDSGSGRIHLFAGDGGANSLDNNTPLSPASSLWGNMATLRKYDIMMNSCECSPDAAGKPQAMMDNVKAYADTGGRVFLSHYHSIWIEGEKDVPTHAPAVWPEIAVCSLNSAKTGTGVIDQTNNPKGSAFAAWMTNVQGSVTPGTIAITESKQSCSSVDATKAERWVFMPITGDITLPDGEYPQNFQFSTPNEVAKDARCGKVVFSDMHVSGDSGSFSDSFPSECSNTPLTAQEKALAFMFFDVASCVGTIL